MAQRIGIIAVAVVLIFIIIGALSGSPSGSATTQAKSSFSDPTTGLSFDFPSNLKMEATPESVTLSDEKAGYIYEIYYLPMPADSVKTPKEMASIVLEAMTAETKKSFDVSNYMVGGTSNGKESYANATFNATSDTTKLKGTAETVVLENFIIGGTIMSEEKNFTSCQKIWESITKTMKIKK